MRRSRRGGHSGMGVRRVGRGFVRRRGRDQADGRLAVHPAADDGHHGPSAQSDRPAVVGKGDGRARCVALAITTPEDLPEAIAGRPYALALASKGGRGDIRWAVDGELPDGLEFDAEAALIRGVASKGTPEPVSLVVRASDDSGQVTSRARLLVYQPDRPLTVPSKYLPALPPIPWREWFDQGFGFLVLALVHLVGMNALGSLERRSLTDLEPDEATSGRRRFSAYRWLLRLATLGSAALLALWLTKAIG